MNASKIAELAAKATKPDAIMRLIQECQPRQQEIRARIVAISQPLPPTPLPSERAKAVRSGLDAVKALDDEIEELDREFSYLDKLQMQLYEQSEAAETEQYRERFPAALREIPSAAAIVREKLAALDKALASLNELINTAGQYERLRKPYVWSDEELANVARLREEVWALRMVRVLEPPGLFDRENEFPTSWGLMYYRRGFEIRRCVIPHRVDLRDVASDN